MHRNISIHAHNGSAMAQSLPEHTLVLLRSLAESFCKHFLLNSIHLPVSLRPNVMVILRNGTG